MNKEQQYRTGRWPALEQPTPEASEQPASPVGSGKIVLPPEDRVDTRSSAGGAR